MVDIKGRENIKRIKVPKKLRNQELVRQIGLPADSNKERNRWESQSRFE